MNNFGTGKTAGTAGKNNFDKISENPFFSFSRPYLDFIGKGVFFNLVYFVMAGINALLPFAIIFKVKDTGIFRYAGNVGAKYIIAFILAWLVIAFACWIGFQLWLYRRKKVAVITSSEFIATLIFSELIQTFGEWLGTFTGIVSAGTALIGSIFFGEEANSLFRMIGMDYMPFGAFGAMAIIIGPIAGFFIIILFRFIAEQFRLFASLVNNTKEIAANIKNSSNGA